VKHSKEWKSCKNWRVPWPKAKDQERMKGYVADNVAFAKKNPHELRVYADLKLLRCGFGWQKWWAFRIFDFWSHKLGCVVEVDGSTHNAQKDWYRDESLFRRYAIVTLRVRNGSQDDIYWASSIILKLNTWKARYKELSIGHDASRLTDRMNTSLLREYIVALGAPRSRKPLKTPHIPQKTASKPNHPRVQKMRSGKKRVRVAYRGKLNLC